MSDEPSGGDKDRTNGSKTNTAEINRAPKKVACPDCGGRGSWPKCGRCDNACFMDEHTLTPTERKKRNQPR